MVVRGDEATGELDGRRAAAVTGLSAAEIRGWVRSGLLTPRRDASGTLRFSFADVTLLRTLANLAREVPVRRLRRAMRTLTAAGPDRTGGARLDAIGCTVIARRDGTAWEVESGQLVLPLEPAGTVGKVAILRREPAAAGAPTLADAAALEHSDARRAIEAYRAVLDREPDDREAAINLGRLLHETGDAIAALVFYRRVLDRDPGDALALFNLGVALQDVGDVSQAIAAYQRVTAVDPSCADAHYNLAHLYERRGDRLAALRHLKRYRDLTGALG